MGTGRMWSSRCRSLTSQVQPGRSRLFCNTAFTRSGHNRWSKIKHDKGKEDALKSKARTLLSQDVFLASKSGGPDPALNARLAIAIASAKRGSLSKASIESAIAKGQGKALNGLPLENVTIEAMLPYGVAALIECQTEQKGRVLQDVRSIITRKGGSVGPTAFLFEKKGKIWFTEHKEISVDDVLDEAIEAGALEVDSEDGCIVVETEPNGVTAVAQRLAEKYPVKVDRTEIFYDPKDESLVSLSPEEDTEIGAIVDAIEQEPSLQNLYLNVA